MALIPSCGGSSSGGGGGGGSSQTTTSGCAASSARHVPVVADVRIVGGSTVSSWDGTNCGAGSNASGAGYYALATSNPVAVYIPTPGSSSKGALCTGALVGTNLVITAAHCFDDLINTATTIALAKTAYPTASAGTGTNTTAYVYFSTTYGGTSKATVTSWSAHPNYHGQSNSSDLTYALNDIAWIKVSSSFGYSPVSILSNPRTISATEEKLMMGFGATSGTSSANAVGAGLLRCTSTYADANYPSRGDILPTSGVQTFDASIPSSSYQDATKYPAAYESYLQVVGPINGSNARGTCFGDSGGPVYVYRSSQWVLASLTQGSNNVLSPQPSIDFTQCGSSSGLSSQFNTAASGACSDGYGIYTTVGNYVSWLQSDSGVTLTTK